MTAAATTRSETPPMVEHPETPPARADREALERDVAESDLRGKPLVSRPRLAAPTLEAYLKALGGPLPYMARLRAIERHVAEHLTRLAGVWEALAEAHGADTAAFEAAWIAVASDWRFDEVNELIDQHNRWFPAESQLPMDPRTGDYRLVHGRPYTLEPLGAGWVLRRFPPPVSRGAGIP